MHRSLRHAAILFATFAFALSGCSAGKVKITGKIMKNGEPMVVSEDTYVTLQFLPEQPDQDDEKKSSYSAKFDQKSGSYTIELPAGKYRTMLVIALPSKKQGELNMPSPPIKSETVYDLSKSQELNIDAPGK